MARSETCEDHNIEVLNLKNLVLYGLSPMVLGKAATRVRMITLSSFMTQNQVLLTLFAIMDNLTWSRLEEISVYGQQDLEAFPSQHRRRLWQQGIRVIARTP